MLITVFLFDANGHQDNMVKLALFIKSCDILHIVKLDDGRECAFLIQDMFLITEEYIEREYTIAGNHLMLTSEHTVKEIEQKTRKVMGMLKHGIKFTPTQPDVMAILEKLRERR